ncbi:uncharacterized protein LOC144548339 [Carex rostrata]
MRIVSFCSYRLCRKWGPHVISKIAAVSQPSLPFAYALTMDGARWPSKITLYMLDSSSTEVQDGTVPEVAEQLIIMHEDCLEGKYESIQKLKQLAPRTNAVSQSKQVVNDDDGESSDSETDSMEMEATQKMDVDPVKMGTKPGPDPDRWTVVPNKHNRGRRSN